MEYLLILLILVTLPWECIILVYYFIQYFNPLKTTQNIGIRTHYTISAYLSYFDRTSARRSMKIFWFIKDCLKTSFCFVNLKKYNSMTWLYLLSVYFHVAKRLVNYWVGKYSSLTL